MSTPSVLYRRPLKARITEALSDTPVVLVAGPRQAGKTTLVRQLADRKMRYLTLDDELTRLAAREDPVGMVRELDRAIIDEIQRAPELLLAIKRAVDEDRRPGRFLLTGSANLMTLPTVADSLAGRMETLTLLPLSRSEIQGTTLNWFDCAFDGRLPKATDLPVSNALVDVVLSGGYPEALAPRRGDVLPGPDSISMPSSSATCATWPISNGSISCRASCAPWLRCRGNSATTPGWARRSAWITRRPRAMSVSSNSCIYYDVWRSGPETGSAAS